MDKMFKFVEDYEPEKCIDIITHKCQKLADYYGMSVTFSRTIEVPEELKYTDVYCILNCSLFTPDGTYQVDIVIPNIRNSFCLISGVKRYIQKQIIDSCFVSMGSPTMERVVCELDAHFTVYKKNDVYYFSVKGNPHVEACATYLQLCKELGVTERLSELASSDPIVEAKLAVLQDKKDFLRAMSPFISDAQKKKVLEYVKVYYYMSDLLQEYFENPADIVYQLIANIEHVDTGVGLDLTTRRVRTILDLVTSTMVSQVMDFVLNTKYVVHKKRRQKHIRVEPFQELYDFVLVETMFNAPLASVANRARCTILGKGGFTREGTPTKIKDLHPSQYNCLDPAVTPDRENAGVVLYLATTAELDHLGRFKINEDFMTRILRQLRQTQREGETQHEST